MNSVEFTVNCIFTIFTFSLWNIYVWFDIEINKVMCWSEVLTVLNLVRGVNCGLTLNTEGSDYTSHSN
jgi:hypothetical protein